MERIIEISGASDDLIHVGSDDGVFHHEYNTNISHDLRYFCVIEFDDGAKVYVRYDKDGLWKVEVAEEGSRSTWEYNFVAEDPDSYEYSDRLLIKGDLLKATCFEVTPVGSRILEG